MTPDFSWLKLETFYHLIAISVCLIDKTYSLLIVLYVCESFILEGQYEQNQE